MTDTGWWRWEHGVGPEPPYHQPAPPRRYGAPRGPQCGVCGLPVPRDQVARHAAYHAMVAESIRLRDPQ